MHLLVSNPPPRKGRRRRSKARRRVAVTVRRVRRRVARVARVARRRRRRSVPAAFIANMGRGFGRRKRKGSHVARKRRTSRRRRSAGRRGFGGRSMGGFVSRDMLTQAAAGAAGIVGAQIILPKLLAKIAPAGASDTTKIAAKAALAIAAKMLLGRFVGKNIGNAVATGILIGVAKDVYDKARGTPLAGFGDYGVDGVDYGNAGGFPYVITDGMGDMDDDVQAAEFIEVGSAY